MDFEGHQGQGHGDRRKAGAGRNYKLVMDPQLSMGPQKVYRFDGVHPEVCINMQIKPLINEA